MVSEMASIMRQLKHQQAQCQEQLNLLKAENDDIRREREASRREREASHRERETVVQMVRGY